MELLEFIKTYWVQLAFVFGIIASFFNFANAMIEATKCSLRNDILTIWDKCKEKGQITRYQLQALYHSYAIYKKLKGNSFVAEIVEKIKKFEIVD